MYKILFSYKSHTTNKKTPLNHTRTTRKTPLNLTRIHVETCKNNKLLTANLCLF